MNNETKAKKYIIYLRKSTDDKEKQILSLEKQEEVTDRLRKNNNAVIIEIIIDKKTAKKPGRPGFNRMMHLIKTGKADGIIVWSAHRLSRNAIDTGELITALDQKLLKEVVTDTYIFRTNPTDSFVLWLQCAQAKLENDNKAIDVRDGMETCAKIGIYPGCPPIGYLPDKGGVKGARKRDIDPVRFPLVQKMWKLMLTERYTPSQILAKATDEWGLRTRKGYKLCKSMMYYIFNNPFYCGEFEWPRGSGMLYKGIHKPMITKEEFLKVQRILEKPGRAKPSKHYFMFGGCLLHCGECTGAISGDRKIKRQKNGNVHEYVYYGCMKRKNPSCTQLYVRDEELEKQVVSVLESIYFPEKYHAFFMEWVKKENEHQFKEIYVQKEANNQAYDQMLKKIDGLIDLRSRGQITDEQFSRLKAEAEQEQDRLKVVINDYDRNTTTWLDTADRMFRFSELAVKRFKEGTIEQKRGIVASLGWHLPVIDKKLDTTREKWIKPVTSIATHVKMEMSRLAPQKPLEIKSIIENIFNNSVLCSALDEVRNYFITNEDPFRFPIVDEWEN